MKIGKETPAIVTGGASGLGAAVAALLADRGAPVAILDINAQAGEGIADRVGGRFVGVDMADVESIARALDRSAERQGPARIVVNCAGIAPSAKTVSRGRPHDPALFNRVLAINLSGAFALASGAAASMATLDPLGPDGERGVIVNTASIAAYEGQIGQVAYAASKAGVVGMTLPMARDLAGVGIRVVAIAPGIFLTPMVAGFPQEVQDALAAAVPFPQRLGRPDEFARLVEHCLENPMINGETLRLDGAIRMAPR